MTRQQGRYHDRRALDIEPAIDRLCEERDKLKAINAELLAMLKLAVKYLDHPDVQTIPFALHAECAASRVHAAIAKAQPD